MRSTKSYFNLQLFKKTVTRYWPIWSVYLFILSIVYFFIVREHAYYYGTEPYVEDVYGATISFGLIFSAIVSLATAMFAHSWMYTSRSASAYSCLPIKREGLFLSTSLAGLAPLIASNLIAMLVMALTALYFGINAFYTGLLCFIALSLFNVFSYGLATFCCELTGNAFVVPFIYAIFNFLAVVVEALLKVLAQFFIYGVSFYSDFSFGFLSPIFEMLTKLRSVHSDLGYGIDGWTYIVAYAVVGLILCALSLIIFKKRRIETASDIVAFNPLKPVFKYCLSFGCALTLGLLFYSIFANDFDYSFPFGCEAKNIVILGISMIVAAFIGYFAAEMLINKSFKVFSSKWKGFVCVCVVIAALIAGMYFDIFGIEKHVPDAEDISSISFNVYGCRTEISDKETIELLRDIHSSVIADKDRNREMLMNHYFETGTEEFIYDFHISYTLKNGKELSREYNLYAADNRDLNWQSLEDIITRPDCVESRIKPLFTDEVEYCNIYYTVPADESKTMRNYDENVWENDTKSNYIEITGEEAKKELIPAIIDDIRHGRISDFYRYYGSGTIDSVLYDCSINFSFVIRRENSDYFYYNNISFNPTINSTSTNEALKSLGVELYRVAELYE